MLGSKESKWMIFFIYSTRTSLVFYAIHYQTLDLSKQDFGLISVTVVSLFLQGLSLTGLPHTQGRVGSSSPPLYNHDHCSISRLALSCRSKTR